jgi:hypothetical protein
MPTDTYDPPSTNIVVVSSPAANHRQQGGLHPVTVVMWTLRLGLAALGIWSIL